ncbi:MAG TPA: hypothetical protein DCL48_06805 [Alphaproteobacteria bacterium]|nr:hypothetical protein [Alphaproteobacteria bacterium]
MLLVKGNDLDHSVPRSDWVNGGWPGLDLVLIFQVLSLQARHPLSGERCDYLFNDRPSFAWFLGMSPAC